MHAEDAFVSASSAKNSTWYLESIIISDRKLARKRNQPTLSRLSRSTPVLFCLIVHIGHVYALSPRGPPLFALWVSIGPNDKPDIRDAHVEFIDHDVPARTTSDTDVFRVEVFDIWLQPMVTNTTTSASSLLRLDYDPAGKRDMKPRTVSCFPTLAASAVATTFLSFFSAKKNLCFQLEFKALLWSTTF